MIEHIKRWNEWRKLNVNSWFHKLLVLLKLRNSPTFESMITVEEMNKLMDEALELAEKEKNENGKF